MTTQQKRGICVLTPILKCNCDFALIFLTVWFYFYYSQVNAILPLVNGQNRGKYAKTKGTITMTCEKQRAKSQN